MAYTFGGSPLDSLINGLRASTNAADAGVGAAQSGVNAVLGGGGQIQQAIGDMRGTAGQVVHQGNAVNATAQEVKDTYAKLGPIAALLGDRSLELWGLGQTLSTDAESAFGQGRSLLNMDANAGGLAGEFIKYWKSLDPERYVSLAASDTQKSFQNARGQAERELSRRGVSATSGAFGALQKQFQTAMATVLAATKTKARQTGLDQQAAWLKDMTGAANTLYGIGNSTEQNVLSALADAINAQKAQADTVAAQGQGLAQAGSLQQSAGQLFASAASIYGDVGQLQNQYLSLINQAYGKLSDAQFSKSNAYRNAVATEVSALNGGGGGGGGGGGVNVEQAPEDDWMNWRGTGHSLSWNRNDGFKLAREIGAV